MIGSFGLWSSSKGMKTVSDLVGKTRTDAAAQILADGFIQGTETKFDSTDAADQLKHNTIKSQDPVAGTLFSYELPINTTYISFSFTPFGVFGFSPFSVFGFSPFSVFGFSPFAVFGFGFAVFGFR